MEQLTKGYRSEISKPILFNTDMVRALLDGRKTVTRRVVKWCGHAPAYYGRESFNGLRNELNGDTTHLWAGFYKESDIFFVDGEKHIDAIYFKAPYQPGDILYVRETWGRTYCYDCGMGYGGTDTVGHNSIHIEGVPFKCDDETAERIYFEKEKEYGCYCYKASGKEGEVPEADGRWHPSIHMPKKAARIFLRVTNVQVERLQEITVTGLQNEGFLQDGYISQFSVCSTTDLFLEFQELWNSTIKRADTDLYGWAANPWVWVIEFERIHNKEAVV